MIQPFALDAGYRITPRHGFKHAYFCWLGDKARRDIHSRFRRPKCYGEDIPKARKAKERRVAKMVLNSMKARGLL